MGVSGWSTVLFFFLSIPLTVLAEPIELTSPGDAFGGFGFSVSALPDVNGDGLPDVVVGAPEEDLDGMEGAGRAYIVDGSSGALLRALASPFPEEEGRFGISVAGISDLNGNGFGDVIIGAYWEDWEDSHTILNPGRVYVFDGGTGQLLKGFVPPNPRELSGWFGEAVATVPDVNGDGCDDLVVGAPHTGFFSGKAFIFDASTGALLHTLQSPDPESVERFGGAVAGIPDVNGDGNGDVIVGQYGKYAPGWRPDYPFDGSAYIFDGSTGARLHTLSPGPLHLDEFGSSVAGVADITGDGRGDVIVGAYGDDLNGGPAPYLGRAFIFDGSSGALVETLKPPAVSAKYFGWTVCGIPDTTGDGRPDIAITANGKNHSGYVHLYDGVTRRLFQTLESPGRQKFGWSLAGVPDVNGDGRGELLIGASKFGGPQDVSGENYAAYIYHSPFLSPEIELDPPALDFGERMIDTGPSEPMAVLISNVGDGDLLFTKPGIELTGEDAEDFLIVGTVAKTPLLPGATREVNVEFVPQSPGEKQAYLTVTSNDLDEPIATTCLKGIGTDERLRILASPSQSVHGHFGANTSYIPDINGDGLSEIGVNGYGSVYVFDVFTGELLHTFISPNGEDGFLGVVSGIIGVDGYGLLIGGGGSEDPGPAPEHAGRAYLFDGISGEVIHTLVSPHEQESGGFGGDVSGIYDVNGDDLSDIVVGAPGEAPGKEDDHAGRAYILDGSSGQVLHTFISPNKDAPAKSRTMATTIRRCPDSIVNT